MEITKVFKATVKAVKARRKDIVKEYSPNILPKANKKDGKKTFHQSAIDVVASISKLRDFLLNYQLEYLGQYSHLISISSRMTEEERDQIDGDTQTFIKSCTGAISSLKGEVLQIQDSEHYKSHAEAVVELLEFYLKDICKLYAKQKAIRVKQTVDRNRILRLVPDVKDSEIKQDSKKSMENEDVDTAKEINKNNLSGDKLGESKGNVIESSDQKGMTELEDIIEDGQKNKDENISERISLSPQEMQMFEEENELLYSELTNTIKEVKNIEGKVMEIGQLQEIFQEKVIAQSSQIETLYETSVETTENVKEGNEQIREAIKNSATFRVWILFFLMMCTFSLLFLDWYNY